MMLYCLKSILCLAVLWMFYCLFLEKERLHFFKRWYLLGSIIFSLTLPLLTITYYKKLPATSILPVTSQQIITPVTKLTPIDAETTLAVESTTQNSINTHHILLGIYILGFILFGFRFSRNLYGICSTIKRNVKQREVSYTLVLLKRATIPHTFLNFIFISKHEYDQQHIPDQILAHESVHVSQKHTWDILFVEITHLIFWFNPVFILLKQSIRLNHEFLADQGVLQQEFSIRQYIQLLVTYPNGSNQTILTSPINYSITKKRLQMMTKHFSLKRVVLKMCSLSMLLLGCVLIFNHQLIAKERVVQKYSETPPEIVSVQTTKEQNRTGSSSPPTKLKHPRTISTASLSSDMQEEVSKKQFNYYKNWAKKIHAKVQKGGKLSIKEEQLDAMEALYNRMSTQQQSQVESFQSLRFLASLSPDPTKTIGLPSTNITIIAPEPPVSPTPPTPPTAAAANSHAIQIPEVPSVPDMMKSHVQSTWQQEIEMIAEQTTEAAMDMVEAQIESLEHSIENEQLQETTLHHMHEAKERANEARRQALEQAHEARRKAHDQVRIARNQSLQAAREHREAMREQAMIAREVALKKAHSAKEPHENHTKISHAGSVRMLERLDTKNTTFFYKKNSISKKQAIAIVKNAGKKLSLAVKTVNNTTKVKIKD